MAQDIKRKRGPVGEVKTHVVDTGITVQVGDPVYLDAGELKLATDSTEIYGFAREAVTSAAAGTKIDVEVATPATEYQMKTTGTITIADEGEYFGLAITGNVFTVDKTGGVTTTTGRQVLVTKFIDGTTCLVRFVNVQAFATAA
jgi:hypothetical protein